MDLQPEGGRIKVLFRSLRVLFSAGFQADPVRAAVVMVLSPMSEVSAALQPYLLKLFIDGALAGSQRQVVIAVAVLTAVGALGMITAWARFTMSSGLDERTNQLMDERLIRITAGMPGLEHLERPEYANQVALFASDRGVFGSALSSVVYNITVFVRVGMTAVLLASLHPALLLMPALGIPPMLASARAERLRQKAREATAEPGRIIEHIVKLATTATTGKELRIFGLRGELIDRHQTLWRERYRTLHRASLRGAVYSVPAAVTLAVGYTAAIALVARLVVQGRATPGQLLMALLLAAQVHWQVGQVISVASWFAGSLKAVARYLWLMDYAESATMAPEDPTAAPDRIARGIDLRGVSFRYPGTERDVLSGVDLHFPPGSTIAIVGENGAGKTTLMKLLCRFYDPTEGSVLIDGIDVKSFQPDEWRRRISSTFQDFVKFELIARETVGVGELEFIQSVPAVEGALARANARDVVDRLGAGLDSQLGRTFDEGAELSGGQWQKLALARGMMRESPLLLILDEPTASLDAHSEHQLFERYAEAAKRAGEAQGTITLLVSHRFSTVRMADLIVVIEGGRVVEAGSHEELAAAGGLYSELFELQARSYR